MMNSCFLHFPKSLCLSSTSPLNEITWYDHRFCNRGDWVGSYSSHPLVEADSSNSCCHRFIWAPTLNTLALFQHERLPCEAKVKVVDFTSPASIISIAWNDTSFQLPSYYANYAGRIMEFYEGRKLIGIWLEIEASTFKVEEQAQWESFLNTLSCASFQLLDVKAPCVSCA